MVHFPWSGSALMRAQRFSFGQNLKGFRFLSVVIALTFSTACAALTGLIWSGANEAAALPQRLKPMFEYRALLQETLPLLQKAETAVRVVLRTGDSAAATGYATEKAAIESHLRQLENEALRHKGHTHQPAHLYQALRLIRQKMKFMSDVIQARVTKGRDNAFNMIVSGKGLSLNAGIAKALQRASFDEMEIIQNELQTLGKDARAYSLVSILVLIFLGAAALITAITALHSFKQSLAAKAAREHAHSRVAEFVEISNDWFWETDHQLTVNKISAGRYAPSGIPLHLAVGRKLGADRLPGIVDDEWKDLTQAVRSKKPFRNIRCRINDDSGRKRSVTFAGKPIFDSRQELAGYIGTARDITEEIEAADAIGAEKSKLAVAMEASPGGIALVDANGIFLGSNSEGKANRARDGLFSKPGQPYVDVLQECIDAGGGELANENAPLSGIALYRKLREFGQPFEVRFGQWWFLMRSVKLADGGMVVGTSDITSIKAREIELARAKELAELANHYKSDFLATMSHELRNPLTSIIGSLSIIIANPGGDIPAKVSRLLQVALDNSRRLVRLINEILDVERIESGLEVLTLSTVRFIDPVSRAVEAMRGFATSRDIEVELDPSSSTLPVCGDADRLQQAVINLLSNAIKFSPAGGRVNVIITAQSGILRLSITDQGCGIPEAFKPRVFDRFAQATKTNSMPKEGTGSGSGLGLAIAKSIVEHSGGRISFTSVEGAGTTFVIELPVPVTAIAEAAA